MMMDYNHILITLPSLVPKSYKKKQISKCKLCKIDPYVFALDLIKCIEYLLQNLDR